MHNPIHIGNDDEHESWEEKDEKIEKLESIIREVQIILRKIIVKPTLDAAQLRGMAKRALKLTKGKEDDRIPSKK